VARTELGSDLRRERDGGSRGLELSRAFFYEWGLPEIDRQFPGLRDHVAAGLFEGSQALGADDEFSQDHAWGPTVHLFTDGQFGVPEAEIAARLSEGAPDEFMGVRRSPRDVAVRVQPTAQFFRAIFSGDLPEDDLGWVHRKPDLRESRLYFLRHGQLFHDGAGDFGELRQRFSTYPADVLAMRMATCCNAIAHYGEYNLRHRLCLRSDVLPTQIALGEFIEAVLRMYFYLENDFAPYWKWLSFEFRRRGFSPQVIDALEDLPRQDRSQQPETITKVLESLTERLVERRVVSRVIEDSGRVEIPLFFRFTKLIRETIKDEGVRKLI
jgi:hypothetical protein